MPTGNYVRVPVPGTSRTYNKNVDASGCHLPYIILLCTYIAISITCDCNIDINVVRRTSNAIRATVWIM
jgi:hypothetical protein